MIEKTLLVIGAAVFGWFLGRTLGRLVVKYHQGNPNPTELVIEGDAK
jgi:hypothetical protein